MVSPRGIRYYLDLITVLTQKEIKVRYKNSLLGYFWSIANPLLYALVFFFVFKIIMRFPIKNYTLFLISGLFPWQWISNSTTASTGIYIANVSLIKKIVFPRFFLPLAQVLNDGFHFIVSIPVIVVFLIFYHKTPGISWLYDIPLLLIPTFMVNYGLALMAASINVFFRDLQYLIGLIITILFYITPVFYDISFVPKKYRMLVYANPFTSLISNWRLLFMQNQLDWKNYIFSLIYSTLILIIGFFVYLKLKDRFAEVL